MRPIDRNNPPGGFTLIELTVVIAILVMLLSVAVVSMRSPYRAARLEDAIERISSFDRQLRNQARRFDRLFELKINLRDSSLEARSGDARQKIEPLRLGAGLRIDRVKTKLRQVDYRELAIPISCSGHSPTYALRLRGADDRKHWLVFTGVSGQLVRIEKDREIDQLFKLLSPPRPDAD
jgi:prepilin-type N-terminal cleavage/methylation domain-containing protein